jgi:hypothetical protein
MRSQLIVRPIDATSWSKNKNQYVNVNTNAKITQAYNVDGTPSNMGIYHNWASVTDYDGANDGGLIQSQVKDTAGTPTGTVPAGTYRLRVDSLSYDGKNAPPASGGAAHKGYAVRAVLDAKGLLPCVTCAVSAWDDMAYYTPITGGSFAMPVFALTPDYAGRTISVDVFDPGDVSGSGTVDMSILGPSLTGQGCGTTVATPTPPQTVTVLDFGIARASPSPALISSPATATFRATTNGNHPYNGHWVEMRIPVPSGYSPGTWCLQYTISTGGISSDTLTLAVGLEGNPAHLISG